MFTPPRRSANAYRSDASSSTYTSPRDPTAETRTCLTPVVQHHRQRVHDRVPLFEHATSPLGPLLDCLCERLIEPCPSRLHDLAPYLATRPGHDRFRLAVQQQAVEHDGRVVQLGGSDRHPSDLAENVVAGLHPGTVASGSNRSQPHMSDRWGMVSHMFERTRDYPTALTASSAGNPDAVKAAVGWLLTRTKELGGQPLLYFPGKRNIEAEPLLEQLAGRIPSATWRTLHGGVRWTGGVVLAAWPDMKHLAEIADDRRTTGLVVLTWSEKDVAGWAAAAQPEILSPGVTVGTATISDPVVEKGLETLSALVNHGNALAGSLDRRDAITVLQTLHDGRHDWSRRRSTPGPWRTGGPQQARRGCGNSPRKSPRARGRGHRHRRRCSRTSSSIGGPRPLTSKLVPHEHGDGAAVQQAGH